MKVHAMLLTDQASEQIMSIPTVIGLEVIAKIREYYENVPDTEKGFQIVQIYDSQNTSEGVFVEHEHVLDGMVKITRIEIFTKGQIPDHLLDIYNSYKKTENPNERKNENDDS